MPQPEALCSVPKITSMAQNAHSLATRDTQWQALPAGFVRRIQLHPLASGQEIRQDVNVRNLQRCTRLFPHPMYHLTR